MGTQPVVQRLSFEKEEGVKQGILCPERRDYGGILKAVLELVASK